MEIFDYINNLFHKRFRYPTDQELSGKMWVINRVVSMDVDLLEWVALVSKYLFTLGNQYYRLLYRIIPQSKSPRNKYYKVKNRVDDKLVDRYCRLFQLGKGEVADYLRILRKQYSDKEIYEFVGLEKEDK